MDGVDGMEIYVRAFYCGGVEMVYMDMNGLNMMAWMVMSKVRMKMWFPLNLNHL